LGVDGQGLLHVLLLQQQRDRSERHHENEVGNRETHNVEQGPGIGTSGEGVAVPDQRDEHRDRIDHQDRMRPLEQRDDRADREQHQRRFPGAALAMGELARHDQEREADHHGCHVTDHPAVQVEQVIGDSVAVMRHRQ
jgi:hypothetical protein